MVADMKLMIFAVIFLSLASVSFAYDTNDAFYPFTKQEDADRFQMLTKEIRCVVCQNQTIYDSDAPLADDLRTKVYRMVLLKKSDDEIKDYLVKRYGEFILFKPRFNLSTFLLWFFPAIGFSLTLAFIFYYQKKSIC
jgi:cytochrome c-type biogenesis protein CcmH